MGIIHKIDELFKAICYEFVLHLPEEFTKLRINLLRGRGAKIHSNVAISPNVRIRGKFEMGQGSSIAQNCTINGENAGVFIGENVMIAPNVVIVAFSHIIADLNLPMNVQGYNEAPIKIENDVWIASNCTIAKGVTVGRGAVIAANSFVNKDVPPFSIVGGVPFKILKTRMGYEE